MNSDDSVPMLFALLAHLSLSTLAGVRQRRVAATSHAAPHDDDVQVRGLKSMANKT
jgi:hypothetical protein